MPVKRRAILDAAQALFLAQGYGATSMDAIAAAAPVSKRTLYQHFEGKAALFAAMVAEAWAHLGDAANTHLTLDDDPALVLRAFCRALTTHWQHPAVMPLLRVVIAESPRRFPELATAFYAHGKGPGVGGLTLYFDRLIAAGRLAPPPACHDTVLAGSLMAVQFLGMVKEALFWPRIMGQSPALDDQMVIEAAIARLLAP